MDFNLLQVAIRKLQCPTCGGFIDVTKKRTDRLKVTFQYLFTCNSCAFEIVERSSPLFQPPNYIRRIPDLNLRLTASATAVGLKYSQVHQFFDLLGINCVSNKGWQTTSDEIFEATEQVSLTFLEQEGQATGEALNNIELDIDIDTTTSTKRIRLCGVCRQAGHDRRKCPTAMYDYIGTSRGMEGYLVDILFKKMKGDGLNPKSYAHDNDGVTRNKAEEIFPNMVEYLDIGHSERTSWIWTTHTTRLSYTN